MAELFEKKAGTAMNWALKAVFEKKAGTAMNWALKAAPLLKKIQAATEA